jgi:alpha-D-ribose 1-methylphosphonate 5-triphosphate synthase subunit PhnI
VSRPESSQEHLPTSIAEVLRLRAIKASVCDKSAKRFAQDDDFVVSWKRFAQDDGFVWGLEIQVVGYAENTKRSKKSQALEMTILFAW